MAAPDSQSNRTEHQQFSDQPVDRADSQSGVSSEGDDSGFARSLDHYDAEKDMILRVECLSRRELKGVLLVSFLLTTAALALLVMVIELGSQPAAHLNT
ncbi:hypothetical protein WJX72_001990 [[Myrmecia] bisecta]|uniref:Uncharacterized protein n=1 Tax=[Myrmecia] bisecta TaxID=41462 RepID=A0AAW1PGQ1_9CHLO